MTVLPRRSTSTTGHARRGSRQARGRGLRLPGARSDRQHRALSTWIMGRMSLEPSVVLIRPEQLTTKAPYAYAAVAGPGEFVFTAGACPLDAEGRTVAVGDVAGQTHQVVANLVTALHAAGAQLT